MEFTPVVAGTREVGETKTAAGTESRERATEGRERETTLRGEGNIWIGTHFCFQANVVRLISTAQSILQVSEIQCFTQYGSLRLRK